MHDEAAGPPDLDSVAGRGGQAAGGAPDGGIELLRDLDRPRAWMLLADGVPQSHVDLDDPRYLELEYVRWLGHLIDLAAPAGTPLRVLHLGAGALTLARYVAATRPGSAQLAVEADPVVLALVASRLPLRGPGGPANGEIQIRVADARAALADLPAESFELVIADVFDGGSTPAHLTSAEFTAAAARVLAPGGIFAANIGDGPPLTHARGRVAAVRSVLRHVCLIAEPAVLRGRRFGNLVVAGSNRALPTAAAARQAAADPFPARLVAGQELDQFVAGTAPITDEHAQPSPVPPPTALW